MISPAKTQLCSAVSRFSGLLAAGCLLLAVHPATAADTKDAKKADTKKEDAKKADAKGKSDGKADSKDSAPKELPIPQSAFTYEAGKTYEAKVLRDPFFPDRLKPKPPVKPPGPGPTVKDTNSPPGIIQPPPPPKLSEDLVLKGITGQPNRRFALIVSSVKSYTFETGEQQMVRGKELAAKVKVIAIKDKSVILQVDGETGQKELALPAGP